MLRDVVSTMGFERVSVRVIVRDRCSHAKPSPADGVVSWRWSLRAWFFKSHLMLVVGTLTWGELGVSSAVITIGLRNTRGG